MYNTGMGILKQPEPDPELVPFNDGLAALKQGGKVVGHIATSVDKFWSPFSPLSLQWQIWSVIVWKDGTKERAIEDYAPWSYVKEMKNGKFSWNDAFYEIEWLPLDKAKRVYKELNIQAEDF
jgi:hypothetical protein